MARTKPPNANAHRLHMRRLKHTLLSQKIPLEGMKLPEQIENFIRIRKLRRPDGITDKYALLAWAYEQTEPVPPRLRIQPGQTLKTYEEGQAFYRTDEWKWIRLQVLIRDGRRCVCCGASPETGAVMNVDHIKPLRLNWDLRLDENNLQVLCADCNVGKGNRIETDFRPTAAQ